MSFHHVTTLKLPGPVMDVASSRNSWLLRGLDYVAEVDLDKFDIKWLHTIVGDYNFSYQRIFSFDEIVIFVAHRNSDPNEVWLWALKGQTGEPLWHRQLNWKAFDNYGGLLDTKQGLILIEYTNQAPHLLLISPLTGQVISQSVATIVEGAGTTRSAEESAAYVANKAYFYQRGEALYCFSLLGKEQNFKQILKGNVKGLTGQGVNLYYYQHPSDIFWLSGATGKQKAKLTLPNDCYSRKMIAPVEAEGNLLILFKRKMGIARADFRQRKWCWHIGQKEKWDVSYAVWTPSGIIARLKATGGGYLVSLDSATGELQPSPPHPPGRLTGLLHWTGQDLLISTAQGFENRLEVFRPS